MRSFVRKVEMGEHLMYEEMVEASKLMFNEQTESQDVVDFLVALSRKGETAHEVGSTCFGYEIVRASSKCSTGNIYG